MGAILICCYSNVNNVQELLEVDILTISMSDDSQVFFYLKHL